MVKRKHSGKKKRVKLLHRKLEVPEMWMRCEHCDTRLEFQAVMFFETHPVGYNVKPCPRCSSVWKRVKSKFQRLK